MELQRSNTTTLQFRITDKFGAILPDLSLVTDITFMLKNNIEDPNTDAVVTKTLTNGITKDDPDIGYVRVALTPTDTEIPPGVYFFGLKIEYAIDEFNITIKENSTTINTLTIINDVIDP